MSTHVSTRQLILAAITVLASAALAAADVTVYKCVDAQGRVTFGDTACPVSMDTYEARVRAAPTVGWDSRGIIEANADLLLEHELRQARQRAAVANPPARPGFADATRDRELRMRADRIRDQAARAGGLTGYGLSRESGAIEDQRADLWRNPTGR